MRFALAMFQHALSAYEISYKKFFAQNVMHDKYSMNIEIPKDAKTALFTICISYAAQFCKVDMLKFLLDNRGTPYVKLDRKLLHTFISSGSPEILKLGLNLNYFINEEEKGNVFEFGYEEINCAASQNLMMLRAVLSKVGLGLAKPYFTQATVNKAFSSGDLALIDYVTQTPGINYSMTSETLRCAVMSANPHAVFKALDLAEERNEKLSIAGIAESNKEETAVFWYESAEMRACLTQLLAQELKKETEPNPSEDLNAVRIALN